MRIETFEQFLAPMPVDQFLRDIFGVQPIHIKGTPSKVESLISWQELNEAIARSVPYTNVSVYVDGKSVPNTEYVKRSLNRIRDDTPELDQKKMMKLVSEGASVLIRRFQDLSSTVSDVARMLEWSLHGYITAVVFAGWKSVQALPVHWDPEDVFVVQIEGFKNWKINEPERKYPFYEDIGTATAPEATYWEGRLAPGDVLYIPRGWWHQAVPEQAPSLHVTFGFELPTGIDLVYSNLASLKSKDIFRRNLPLFGSDRVRQAFMDELKRELLAEVDRIDLSRFLFERDANATPRHIESLPWTNDMTRSEAAESVWIHWLPPRPSAFREEGDAVSFDAMGSKFTFASLARPVLENLMRYRKISIGNLCALHPDADVVTFIGELASAGLVVTADSARI